MSDRTDDDLHELAEAMRSRHPYTYLARMRERSPYSPSDGLVVVGRHDHCSRILRHPQLSSVRGRARINRRAEPPSRTFLNLDPPDHTRLRRLVTKAFTPRMVSGLAPSIQAETDDLLDTAAERGRLDVVTDLASPMPLSVICTLLGVPATGRAELRGWMALLSQQLDLPELRPDVARISTAIARARVDVVRYFKELIEFRRTKPGDDLISQLVAVQADGDQLTESELISTCILLLNAGHDTSVNLIGNGVLALLDHPRQWDLLAENRGRAPAVVEEVLRYDSPVQLVTRVATAALDLDGFTVAEGDLIVLLLGAANRDPEVFAEPDLFDLDRTGSAAHLSFAAGPHFCLGAGLARLEAAIALEALATRLVRPRLEPAGLTYRPNVSLRGPEHLPVTVQEIRGKGAR